MRTLRIAIVEDDPIVREISQSMLTVAGHAVQACDSGFEILDRCLTRDERFDVIVLDIVMPGLSGLEVARSVGSQPQHRGTRFVFISALPAALEKARSMHGENAAYLAKPYEQGDLLGAIASATS